MRVPNNRGRIRRPLESRGPKNQGSEKDTSWIEPARYREGILRHEGESQGARDWFLEECKMRKTGESSVARLGGFLNFRRKPGN